MYFQGPRTAAFQPKVKPRARRAAAPIATQSSGHEKNESVSVPTQEGLGVSKHGESSVEKSIPVEGNGIENSSAQRNTVGKVVA